MNATTIFGLCVFPQEASVQDQQEMVVRVLSTIAGPAVPPVYKLFMAPWPWAPFLTAFFTPPFFKVFVWRVWFDGQDNSWRCSPPEF